MPPFIVPNETIVLTMQQRKLCAPDPGQSDRWKSYPYGDWPDPIELDPNGSQYLYCLYAERIIDD